MEVLLRNLDQELAMVCLCSGSEISFVTAMALCEVLQVGKVSQVMSCKADVRKQGFITEVIHKLRGGQGCLVEDVCDLASPRASCVAHGRRCKVRAGLIGSCGFSCKNFSKLHSLHGRRADWMQEGSGAAVHEKKYWGRRD